MLFFVFFVKETFQAPKTVFHGLARRVFAFLAGFWFKLTE